MLEIIRHILLLPVIIVLTILKVFIDIIERLVVFVATFYFAFIAIAALAVLFHGDFQMLLIVGLLAAVGIVILASLRFISEELSFGLHKLRDEPEMTIEGP